MAIHALLPILAGKRCHNHIYYTSLPQPISAGRVRCSAEG